MPTRLARLALASLLLVVPLAAASVAGELQVHVIKVGNAGNGDGQGLSVFVLGPNGTRVLIDGGNAGDGSAIVAPYLQSLGVTDLDLSFMTHWHTDHMGGLDEVLNAGLKPPTAYDRGDANRPSNTQVTQYLSASSGIRATPAVGQSFDLGDGATIQVVAINGATIGADLSLSGGENQYENAASMALLVRYRDFECYVGGDVTGGGSGTPDVEGLAAAAIGQVEVVVAAHHGSNTSSQASAASAFSPSLVIYSCGTDNPYGHPDDRVIANFGDASDARVQWCTTEGDTVGSVPNPEAGGFTALRGHVVVTTDGLRFTSSSADGTDALEFATWESPGLPPAAGDVVVSELLIDPAATADVDGEWFELLNGTPDARDLGGMRFDSGTSSVTLASRVLLRQGVPLVVGRDGKPYRNGGQFTHVTLPEGSLSLSNGTSSLTLLAPGGATMETVNWGSSGVPVTSGAAAERLDVFNGPSAANFQTATTAWSGGDLGTPGDTNGADATSWSPGLWMPTPYLGGTAEFHLTSFSEPLTLYLLAVSTSIAFPGIPFLGFLIPLTPDALMMTLLENPAFISNIGVDGKRTVTLPVPTDPALTGLRIYGNFITLDVFPVPAGKQQSNLSSFVIGA
jgi:beta-lactamase superfamily II metal-dependent hydrolase